MKKWLVWFDLPVLLGWATAIIVFGWAWDAHHLIGMGSFAVGFVLWLTARLQLGRSFSIRARAKALVTTGLYSKFRNPIYLFGGLAYGGLVFASSGTVPLIVFVLLYPTYQFLRAKKEEAVLEAAFGDEYRRYKATTWM